jgi:tetratricopeptide (TPR) repeat protein
MRTLLILTSILSFFSCQKVNNELVDNETAELKALADSSYSQNNYVESINLYTELIEIDSTTGEYFYKRGYSYIQIDSLKLSNIDYHKSASLGYRKSDAYYNIGLNYLYELHDYPLAREYFLRALYYNPTDKSIMVEIAVCDKLIEDFDTKD